MKKFNCPSCGAEVIFQSNYSIYSVCNYCSSMLVRHDINVETIGTMAALPEDMSPLQIGSCGVYRGVGFKIVGRLKVSWKQGAWNEWYILFETGGDGWIAEAQGFYALSHEFEEPLLKETMATIEELISLSNSQNVMVNTSNVSPEASRKTPLGTSITFNHQRFKVVDIKQAVCNGSEGELPFLAPQGHRTSTIDLLGPFGEFASIEVARGKTRIFLGNYVEWDDLHLQQLRPLEGW